jgi:hypothetical protein
MPLKIDVYRRVQQVSVLENDFERIKVLFTKFSRIKLQSVAQNGINDTAILKSNSGNWWC